MQRRYSLTAGKMIDVPDTSIKPGMSETARLLALVEALHTDLAQLRADYNESLYRGRHGGFVTKLEWQDRRITALRCYPKLWSPDEIKRETGQYPGDPIPGDARRVSD